jgi:DNA-binding NtrC family response regulator
MKRVLVVDDDRLMVRTLCDLLRLRGWEVECVYNGPDAVAAVANGLHTLVLMDIKMPGMDGVSAFREMKRHRPGIRVILMTAYTSPERLEDARKEHPLRVLSKPVPVESLLGLMDGELETRRPVLIVDEDADFLHSMADLLSLHGFQTVGAGSLEAAVAQTESETPMAVLLHLRVADGPPEEAVLKLHDQYPNTALIVYSGHMGALAHTQGILEPDVVHAYIEKPVIPERLTEMLDAIIGD